MRQPTRDITQFDDRNRSILRELLAEAGRDTYELGFMVDSVPAGRTWRVGSDLVEYGSVAVLRDMVAVEGYVIAEGTSGTIRPRVSLFRKNRDFAQITQEVEVARSDAAYEFTFLKWELAKGDIITMRARTDTDGQLTNAKVQIIAELSV